jgi:hypothetical protein
MIFSRENFLSKTLCDEIIDIYNVNYSKQNFEYGGTYPYWIYHDEEYKTHHDSIKSVIASVTDLCRLFDKESKLETCQVVKWPVGASQQEHVDPPGDTYAALVYLNDDYTGGETCFHGAKITPEKGKLLLFSSRELYHWVNFVREAERYTLALWFTK